MPEDKATRLQSLIHSDSSHVYSDDELDAIEHIDMAITVCMKGACVGCPNAVLDLKNVVERLLKKYAPGVQKVDNVF